MRYLFLLLTTFVVLTGRAQLTQDPEPGLYSPHQTIYTHLFSLQPESYSLDQAASTIYAPHLSAQERGKIAKQIKEILDGMGIYVDINLIPKDANYVDSTYNKSVFFIEGTSEKIYVEKINDNWLYGATTVSNVPILYAEVFPFGTSFLKKVCGESAESRSFLGLHLWQWLGVFLMLLAAFVVFYVIKLITTIVLRWLSKGRLGKSVEQNIIYEKIGLAFSLLVTFYVLSILVPSLLLPITFSQYFIKAIRIAMILFTALLAIRLLSIALLHATKLTEKTSSKLDDQLIPIVNRLSRILLLVVAGAFVLRELNVDIRAIFAGLSVGALALALAAQDTVKNFIGSVTIFLDHPFEIGDYIVAGGVEGSVEEVGMRATRIRTPNQSVAYVPNGQLANMVVDNIGLRVFRRWKSELGISYNTSPEQIKAFKEGVIEIINANEHTLQDKTKVYLNNLGASALNISMDVFSSANSLQMDMQNKESILLAILTLAEQQGIEFAFPTQTIMLENKKT